MVRRLMTVAMFMTLLMLGVGQVQARVIEVPEEYLEINLAIENAQEGDTISVWGPRPGEPPEPPYYYDENLCYQDKSILVVNRSYLPGQVPYPPSRDWVQIIAVRDTSTVVMGRDQSPLYDQAIKGFTIRNPFRPADGAGIHALNINATIEHCRITGCTVMYRGGGIYFKTQDGRAGSVRIDSCLVDSCSAPAGDGLGGGFYAALVDSGSVIIQGSRITSNFAGARGGGAFVFVLKPWSEVVIQGNQLNNNVAGSQGGGLWVAESLFGVGMSNRTNKMLLDNRVESNEAGIAGGGIYARDFGSPARRNIVRWNEPDGIYTTYQVFGPMNLGTVVDPGFNALYGNMSATGVRRDLEIQSPDTGWAVGNYWGTLDTHKHIKANCPAGLLLSPVAASSRWFDVDLEPGSVCTTDVLVTGDLRVSKPLTIAPGKKLELFLNPDTSLPGGHPDLTDLIVEGAAAILTSHGTAEDTILFTSRCEVGYPGDWYGIRVRDGAQASLRRSEIRAAYCGIDVAPAGVAVIEESKLHGCLFAGVYNLDAQAMVRQCEVMHNEVFGVRYDFPGLSVEPLEASRVEHTRLGHNRHAGVSLWTPMSELPHQILGNVVTGLPGPLAPVCGIEVTAAGDAVSIAGNQVTGFHQAGIALVASSPGLTNNTVEDNVVMGIACLEGSNPVLRRNTVNYSQSGVYCDLDASPDLGTIPDPGMNSILFENVVWVNHPPPLQPDTIWAQENWWGVPDPNNFPEKFAVGRVIYEPWLNEPPGGGGQSSGPVEVGATKLGQLSPMPAMRSVKVPYQVGQAGIVDISVADITGRKVRQLVRGRHTAGTYFANWNLTDNRGRRVSEGVYFLRFEAGDSREVRKFVVAR